MSRNTVLTNADGEQILPISVAGNIFYANQQTVEYMLSMLLDRVNTLDGRIDVLTSLEEGSTSGDAELMDLRTSINGTVYDSAGSAVRAQINTLIKKIAELEVTVNELTRIIDNSGDVTSISSYAKLVGFVESDVLSTTVEEG